MSKLNICYHIKYKAIIIELFGKSVKKEMLNGNSGNMNSTIFKLIEQT